MAIAEMADAREAADTACGRLVHATALDCIDAMRPPWRRAPLRPIIAHRHVDSLVVDGAPATVRTRIEKRASDWMLPFEWQHGPPAPGVVVGLKRLKPAGNTLRHCSHTYPEHNGSNRCPARPGCTLAKPQEGRSRTSRRLLAVSGCHGPGELVASVTRTSSPRYRAMVSRRLRGRGE